MTVVKTTHTHTHTTHSHCAAAPTGGIPHGPQSLVVKFPAWPGWDIPEVDLSLVPNSNTFSLPSTSSTAHVVIDPKHQTDYYSDAVVFRGTVQYSAVGGNGKSQQLPPMQVALKFAMREDLVDDLLHETEVYAGPLSSLQGRCVPRCFGMFAGEREDDGRTLACLVVEWFGEAVKRPFGKLNSDLRWRIFQNLAEIHGQGLIHNDFAERNVLITKNGEVRIIDFDMTQTFHECQRTGHWCGGGHATLTEKLSIKAMVCEEDFGCDELWRAWKQGLKCNKI